MVKAFRINESTITIRVKQVIKITIDGANERIVMRKRTLTATSVSLESGALSNPILSRNGEIAFWTEGAVCASISPVISKSPVRIIARRAQPFLMRRCDPW